MQYKKKKKKSDLLKKGYIFHFPKELLQKRNMVDIDKATSHLAIAFTSARNLHHCSKELHLPRDSKRED